MVCQDGAMETIESGSSSAPVENQKAQNNDCVAGGSDEAKGTTAEAWKSELLESVDAWKRPLIERSEEKWRCEAIGRSQVEYIGKLLAKSGSTSSEWKAALVAQVREDSLWKARLICKVDNDWEQLGKWILEVEHEWKGKLLSECPTETRARLIVGEEDEVRAIAMATAQTLSHAHYCKSCTDDWRLLVMRNCSESWKWPLIERCTFEWQARLVDKCTEKWHAELVLECADHESLARRVLSASSGDPIELWKANLLRKLLSSGLDRDELSWRADALFECAYESLGELVLAVEEEWKGKALSECSSLEMAKLISDEPSESKCRAIVHAESREHAMRIKSCSEPWKIHALKECTDSWKWPFLEACVHEWQAILIEHLEQHWQAAAILACPENEFVAGLIVNQEFGRNDKNLMSKWKADMLFQILNNVQDKREATWKVYALFACSDLERCERIMRCSYHWQATALSSSSTFWKWDAILEAEEEWQAAFLREDFLCNDEWKWHFIKKCRVEWQAMLVCRSDQRWQAEAISNIRMEHEHVARRMFELPMWKWDLVAEQLTVCSTEPMKSWKISFLIDCAEPRRAQMLARCDEEWKGRLMLKLTKDMDHRSEEWRLEHILEEPHEWKCQYIATTEEKWRLDLIKNTDVEWQVEVICKFPEVWKVRIIATLKAGDREMAAQIMSEAVTIQQQVDDILDGKGVIQTLFY